MRWQVPDARRQRNDVAKAYPAILNSGRSGFRLGFNIPAALQHHVVRFIHRCSNDVNGNGSYTDFWSAPVSINAYAQQLTNRWRQIIARYNAQVSIAIQMQDTGEVISYTNVPGMRFITASSVKVSILVELLHNTGGRLNSYQQGLAERVIRNSDNDAASTITNTYFGGNDGLNNIFRALGMTSSHTDIHWGWTLTTPQDQLKLLNEIYFKKGNSYLNDRKHTMLNRVVC